MVDNSNMTIDQRIRHMGLVSLLAECAIQVDEDTRESIERALIENLPEGWTYKRVLNRMEILPLGVDKMDTG